MRRFATKSGEARAILHPGRESRVVAQIIGIRAAGSAATTVRESTCGSNSVLKMADEAGTAVTLRQQEKMLALRSSPA